MRRHENQNKDIYELDVIRKGQRTGGLIALTVLWNALSVCAAAAVAGSFIG